MIIPTCGGRSKYIMKHANLFHKVGRGVFWQSRKFPADPELISIGDNVMIAAGVIFINHDIIHELLNKKYTTQSFTKNEGCIEIGNNVMIGANTIILPNVKIGSDVVIGAGSVITKDVPSNSVVVGVPAKVIGSFDDIVKRYKSMGDFNAKQLWEHFNNSHKL